MAEALMLDVKDNPFELDHTVDAVLTRLVLRTREVLKCSNGLVMLWNEQTQTFVAGPGAEKLSDSDRRAIETMALEFWGLPCNASGSKGILIVPDLQERTEWALTVPEVHSLGIRTVWWAPIFMRSRMFAALFIYQTNLQIPSEEEMRFVKHMADYAAKAILAIQLENSEQRYKSLFEKNRDAVFSLDREGRLIEVNTTCTKLSGYESHDLLQTPVFHYVAEEGISDAWSAFERTLQGENQTVEIVLLHKHGHKVQLRMTTVPMIVDGEIVGAFGIAKDITEQKQAEEQLQSVKEQLESFIQSNADAIAILNMNALVERVNPAFEDMFGWSASEVVGRTLPNIPSERRDKVETRRRMIEQGKSVKGYETVRRRKDGTDIPVSVTLSPIHNEKHQMVGWSAVWRDISERLRAEELMRRSEKLSVAGELAAGVAHEIRNPLTALKGFVQLMQQEGQGVPTYLDIMLSELNRVESIVSELLVLAKPQEANLKIHQVVELVNQVVVLLGTQAILKNVNIAVECEDDPLYILGDENQLKQVFINILKNAIEAMPDGGTVHVGTRRESLTTGTITFRDAGVGIPEDRIPKLGQPFFTTKEQGTGLGLMVSYKIIEYHRGLMEIDSQVGVGTSVRIRLPLVSSQ